MGEKSAVMAFAACSRLLNRIALKAGDKFFSELCSKEADKLLSEFVKFLKMKGDTRSVSQCLAFIFQIRNTRNLLEVLRYLQITKPATPLLLEKNLLLLESAILDSCQTSRQSFRQAGSGTGGNKLFVKRPKKKAGTVPGRLTETHSQILEFIKGKDRVRNLEVFSQFSQISKRTLKRKLSELIKSGSIARRSEGKKVFYASRLAMS